MMKSNRCLKWGALLFNFIVLIVGPTILAVSLRLLFDPEFAHVIFQDGNYYAGHILVAVGALMTVAGIFGCIGTVAENSCLLWMFFGSMLLFLIAEIAGGAYIYNQQDEFLDKLHKTISKAVEKDYSNAPEVTFKLDLIQSGWKCCGTTSFKTWSSSDFGRPQMHRDFISNSGTYKIPKSCCIDQSSPDCETMSAGIRNDETEKVKLIYQEGCGVKLASAVTGYARYFFVTITIVALIQLVAMILTAVFAISIRNIRSVSRFASRQGLNSSYASAPMLSNADSAESKRQFSSSPSVNASRSSLNMEPAMIMSKSSSLV